MLTPDEWREKNPLVGVETPPPFDELDITKDGLLTREEMREGEKRGEDSSVTKWRKTFYRSPNFSQMVSPSKEKSSVVGLVLKSL